MEEDEANYMTKQQDYRMMLWPVSKPVSRHVAFPRMMMMDDG